MVWHVTDFTVVGYGVVQTSFFTKNTAYEFTFDELPNNYELRLFGKCYLDWNNTYFNGIGIFLYLYWTLKFFSREM